MLPGSLRLTVAGKELELGAGEFIRACAREIKKIPEDLARMQELGARYGIRMAPHSSVSV